MTGFDDALAQDFHKHRIDAAIICHWNILKLRTDCFQFMTIGLHNDK